MRALRWDDPEAFDEVLLLVAADDTHRRALRTHLAQAAGHAQAGSRPGAHPRFKVLASGTLPEAARRAAGAAIAMVDLELPKDAGLDAIRALRDANERLAILAYAAEAGPSDAMAAVMAGADFFFDCADESTEALVRAVDVALERRRLVHTIEKNEADVEAARGRLAQLAGELAGTMPGLWPLQSREDVLPFREAARRYLLAATRFFARDPRGLAKALGVSYFALRRLLARYDVPFPAARPRK